MIWCARHEVRINYKFVPGQFGGVMGFFLFSQKILNFFIGKLRVNDYPSGLENPQGLEILKGYCENTKISVTPPNRPGPRTRTVTFNSKKDF